MIDKPEPPKLKEMAAKAQSIIDEANRLATFSPDAARFASMAQDIKDKIELHERTRNLLFDAFLQSADISTAARAGMSDKSSPGVDTLYFYIFQAAQNLGDELQKRQNHEATREPGDFR